MLLVAFFFPCLFFFCLPFSQAPFLFVSQVCGRISGARTPSPLRYTWHTYYAFLSAHTARMLQYLHSRQEVPEFVVLLALLRKEWSLFCDHRTFHFGVGLVLEQQQPETFLNSMACVENKHAQRFFRMHSKKKKTNSVNYVAFVHGQGVCVFSAVKRTFSLFSSATGVRGRTRHRAVCFLFRPVLCLFYGDASVQRNTPRYESKPHCAVFSSPLCTFARRFQLSDKTDGGTWSSTPLVGDRGFTPPLVY